MRKHIVYGLTMGMVAIAQAQTVSVSGKVTDGEGKAVPNATVQLLRGKLKATTDADGMYAIAGTIEGLRPYTRSGAAEMNFRHGILEMVLAQASPIRIDFIDAKGNLLDRITSDGATAGSYRFDLAERMRSDNLILVQASIGSETRVFPWFRMADGAARANASGNLPTRALARSAKVSASVDTLKVTAIGYTAKRAEVSAYDATIDVSLEAWKDPWGGLKNPPMKSSGCGKPALQSGTFHMTSAGLDRRYILYVPANYDPDKPSRLVFGPHWAGGSMEEVQGEAYYFLQPLDTAKNVVFVAPQGYSDASPWRRLDDKDWTFFEDMHRYLLANLCIDSSRVFSTGFSFGGMMTYALSVSHQGMFRAGIGLAPANYHIFLPADGEKTHAPIAWMQTTGLNDASCPWINGSSTTEGSKYIAIEHAKDNGCADAEDVPIWTTGGHFCHEFQGCKPGYPAKVCTFNGPHTNIDSDPGSDKNWIPEESWSFIQRF
jgi:poly(3-hydroxybutyrate) depolymerase